MAAEFLPIIDRVNDFYIQDASLETWNRWYQQYKLVTLAMFERLPNVQRVALLMMKCKGFQPVWEILGIDVDYIDYDDFVSKMTHYLNPTNARRVLGMRKQLEDESFERFASDLEALSGPCRYQDEKILRDFFVSNMHESHVEISDAICRRYDISFEEAVSMAKSMMSQGRFPKDMESNKNMYGFSSSKAPSSLEKDASSVVDVRMVPIKSGAHEVEIVNVNPTDKNTCQVCPTSMLDARKAFFDSFNGRMKKCKDPAVTPIIGCKYAALINCSWYRVDVLTVDTQQKNARISAADFGWINTAPFSVFRNLPLDFRPPAPLVWKVEFRAPMSHCLRVGEIVTIDVAIIDGISVASLASQPFMSSGLEGDTSIKSLPSAKLPFRDNKPRGSASDCEPQPHQKSHMVGVENTQRRGRYQNSDIPDQRRNRSKSAHNRSRSKGRALKEISSGSDTENTQGTKTLLDNSRTTQTRDSVQRADRSEVDRGSHLDNKSEGYPHNNNYRFGRGNLSGRRFSEYHPESASVQSSAGMPVESGSKFVSKRFDRGNAPNFNDRQHSDHQPESASISRSAGMPSESGYKHTNRRFDRGSNASNINGRQNSSFHPESASSPHTTGNNSFDRSLSGMANGRQPQIPNASSSDKSQGSSKNSNFDRASNGNITGRPHSTFQRESGNNQRLASNNKSRDAGAREPTFVPRPVELEQASHGGARNRNQSVREPALRPASRPPSTLTERHVPLNSYMKVHAVDRSPDGEILYCVFEHLMEEFMSMTEEFGRLELEPLTNPQAGGLCLFNVDGSWYRAAITQVHASGLKVKLKSTDFGNKETRNVSELRVLPEDFSDIQPYAFPVKVSSALRLDFIQDIEAMAISRDDKGLWEAQLKIDGVEIAPPVTDSPDTAPPAAARSVAAPPAAARSVAAPPAAARSVAAPPAASRSVAAPPAAARSVAAPRDTQLGGPSSGRSTASTPPARPLRAPPIPRDAFTEVKIVYVGPEGTFAVDDSKVEILHDIQTEMNAVALASLEGSPQLGDLYAAPFSGELFRARVLEVQPNKCLVVFVDFGNEAVIPIRDLKRIPERLCDNIVTFKLRFDSRSDVKVEPAMNVVVTPVAMDNDGTWLVQLQGEPSPGPDHALPADDDGLY